MGSFVTVLLWKQNITLNRKRLHYCNHCSISTHGALLYILLVGLFPISNGTQHSQNEHCWPVSTDWFKQKGTPEHIKPWNQCKLSSPYLSEQSGGAGSTGASWGSFTNQLQPQLKAISTGPGRQYPASHQHSKPVSRVFTDIWAFHSTLMGLDQLSTACGSWYKSKAPVTLMNA